MRKIVKSQHLFWNWVTKVFSREKFEKLKYCLFYSWSGQSDALWVNGRPRRFLNHSPGKAFRILQFETWKIFHPNSLVRAAHGQHRQVCLHLQLLLQKCGNSLPLHRLRRLRSLYSLLSTRRPSPSDGQIGPRARRRYTRRFHRQKWQLGPTHCYPTLYSKSGSCLPVSRCQLSIAVLSKDEASRVPCQTM